MPVAEKKNGIAKHSIYKKVVEKEGKNKEATENNHTKKKKNG